MAVCFCRWRNLLICLCTPCILLVLLFVYITLLVCLTTPLTSPLTTSILNIDHFIAPGTHRNEGWAPSPDRFWEPHLSLGVWNLLQLSTDRSINPILRPYKHSRLPDRGANRSRDPRPAGDPPGSRDPVPQLDRLAGDILEFARHMHKRDYPVVAEPQDACGAGSANDHGRALLLLAIKTKVQNFKNRQIIRSTWGQAGWVAGQRLAGGGYVRRVFLLGTDRSRDNSTAWPDLVTLEGRQYKDILQWDFHDSFFNLTLKDVLFWRWFSRGCRQTHFVFKGDDDVFVNTPALVDYLSQQLGDPGTAMKSFMVGDVIGAAQPSRNNKSKYFVPEAFYAGSYPPYAGGGGVVYSGLLTKLLHLVSKRVHLYPIDDVFVGMCLLKLNAYPSHHPAFLTFDFPGDEETKPCAYHKTIMVHKRMPDRVEQLWAWLKESQPLCWNVTLREDKLKNKP
ncbi:N-acetyllactosaminide beta-1,3-N-acetylglucosaminyltransferase 2 [Gadus chalcogrammus]|uniref:N-acetyllactosaminide beta-1,3-N-acetylglucosaminyltransferase 2 n=1 Tax=Gadus chalcogrammus TaxID=1042646 RepID=UPI0024C477F2|nr:N-acetyllactosaminide beta-1,3-N-acetylglucosaminyltransferase 2 [Gadus chalcogrammus]